MTAQDPAARPRVSVIVPVYNGAQTLPGLLDALEAQDYPTDRREIIVVDDASSDDTARVVAARAPGVRLVQAGRNAGSYHARNLGAAQAGGEILAFTDADCLPTPGWLSAGVAAVVAQGGGLVAGAVTIEPTDRRSAVQRYDAAFGIQQELFARYSGFGATANLFVHRDALAAAGGFDARLRSGGDHAFCRAARRAGAAFGYCAASEVHHLPRTSFGELARKQARVARGLVHIHPRWSQLRPLLLPLRAWRRRALPPLAELDREPWALRIRFAAVYYALLAVGAWAYTRGCLDDPLTS